MELAHGKIPAGARRVGLLPGAFNPPTEAHVALLRAAAATLDAVAFVVPRAYPHKAIEGADLAQRIAMLSRLDFAVLIAEQGLFIDMAREFRRDVLAAEVRFVCGKDAAERITGWDYGEGPGIGAQLEEYGLLVASRQGEYRPPEALAHRIESLAMPTGYDELSSTMARELLGKGHEQWRRVVPAAIADLAESIYAKRRH